MISLVLVLSCALAWPVAAGARPTTKRLAEVNILRATRLLAHWGSAAVDRKKGTLRPNTSVACAGEGKRAGRGSTATFSRYLCVLRYGTHRLTLVYTVGRGRSFTLRPARP